MSWVLIVFPCRAYLGRVHSNDMLMFYRVPDRHAFKVHQSCRNEYYSPLHPAKQKLHSL